jgi:hypothetical protein
MTNGEAFRQMFPDIEVSEHLDSFGFQHGIHVFVKLGKYRGFSLWFPRSWWNAKYKGGKDDERNNIL